MYLMLIISDGRDAILFFRALHDTDHSLKGYREDGIAS